MGYSFRFLKPEHAYYNAWVERQRLRRQAWLAFPLGMLVAAIGIAFTSVLFGDSPWGLVGALTGYGLIVAAQVRYHDWLCPRCGRAFRRGAVLRLDRCGHCELEDCAPCDPAEQSWEFESQMHRQV